MKTCILLLMGACLYVHGYTQGCTPQGNQTSYGTSNVWRGYVYSNMDFTSYAGYVTEGNAGSPNFDESFGGDYVNYPTNGCSVYTETFSVRYKLRKSFTAGYYDITVGGDDGYRLSVDGGSTWIIDHWNEAAYNTTVATVYLSGTTYLVLEFFENGTNNRVSFDVQTACVGTDNQNTYGTNNVWRGYVYDGTAFNTFKGTVLKGNAASPWFDESFGGDAVNYSTNSCSVYTETFSVRYRLRKTFSNGTYVFLVGGDDGYRLSLDGGSSWVIDAWNDHGYQTSSYTVALNGAYNMVLEYYENGGGNRVSFDVSISVLPIVLMQFNGEMNNNRVNLSWTTSLSSNTNYFSIERSADGKNYSPVGEVKAAAGNAVNNSGINYRYTDAAPLSGTSFYRLKMVDDQGVITYSDIVTVKSTTTAALKLYPAVLTSQRSLYLHSDRQLDRATLSFYDMMGRTLWQQPIGKLATNQLMQVALPAHRLTKGMYLAQLKTPAGILLNQMVFVE